MVGSSSPVSLLFGSGGILSGVMTQKRKVFFSFHYDDIMRVNNVRNAVTAQVAEP